MSSDQQTARKPYEIFPCNSASEFIALLRPSHRLWLEGNSRCNWIFRGQQDAALDLTPTAWRGSAKTHPLRRKIDEELADETALRNYAGAAQVAYRVHEAEYLRAVIGQRLFEYRAVWEFIEGIDRLGFPIPGGILSFPNWTEDIFDAQQTFYRGHSTFHPAFALARHHGVSSRLLDWTVNPLFAAFFASEPSDVKLSDRIAVWACRGSIRSKRGRPPLRIYVVERSSIGFVHAQEGLFLFIAGATPRYSPQLVWPRFEDCAEEGELRQVTLPKSQVPILRQLLAAEGINRPRLMPTHDNVADWLNKHWESLSLASPASERQEAASQTENSASAQNAAEDDK